MTSVDEIKVEEGAINVEDHYGLVRNVVKKYKGMFRENGRVDLDDLFQEGVIALILCAKYWREDAHCKFSHYATQAIRHHVSLYIHNVSMIHPPRSTYIAMRSGRLRDSGKGIFEAILAAKNIARHSFHNIVDNTVESTWVPSDEIYVEIDEDLKAVHEMISEVLNEREKDVICGIHAIGRQKETQFALACRWGISPSSVQKVAKKALKKLGLYIIDHPEKGVSVACLGGCFKRV